MLWTKQSATEFMPTKANEWTQILVIGYGNSLRRDDGAGIALAQAFVDQWYALGIPSRLVTDTQLLPEMAIHLADGFVEAVVFVDTEACDTRESDELGIRIAEVTLDSPTASLGHHLDPTTLLVYTALLYGRYPRAWLVTIPGTDFEHGEGFSRQVNQLLAQVAPVANDLLKIIKENVPCMS